MHRTDYLDEVIALHRYIRSNLSCDYFNREKDLVEKVMYSDICGPFCDANVVIEYFAVRQIKKMKIRVFSHLANFLGDPKR